jgi:hypothetical protein
MGEAEARTTKAREEVRRMYREKFRGIMITLQGLNLTHDTGRSGRWAARGSAVNSEIA